MKILAGATVWLRRIVDFALIVLVLAVLFGVILGKVVPVTGRQTIAVGGRSMEPAIPLGAAMVVTPVHPGSLQVGDVVSMQITAANAVFTHRITEIVDRADGRYVQTKGDANADPDPTLVPATAIIGRVDVVFPFMGYLLAVLSIPTGVIFLIGLAATLLAIAWLLESLEPLPEASRPAGTPEPASSIPAVAASGPSGSPVLALPPMLRPVTGGSVLQLVAPGTRTPLVHDLSALPRPGIREQLARSRETRSRRDRWARRGRSSGTAG